MPHILLQLPGKEYGYRDIPDGLRCLGRRDHIFLVEPLQRFRNVDDPVFKVNISGSQCQQFPDAQAAVKRT